MCICSCRPIKYVKSVSKRLSNFRDPSFTGERDTVGTESYIVQNRLSEIFYTNVIWVLLTAVF